MWRRVRAGGARPLCAHDRHESYAIGQRIRKRIEEAFGWIKTVAGQSKTRFPGVERTELAFTFAAAAYNLVRLPQFLEHGMSEPGGCQIVGR
jgi:hypothetical protein